MPRIHIPTWQEELANLLRSLTKLAEVLTVKIKESKDA
jgi:hypothetical protein